jgi:hypothetical protein
MSASQPAIQCALQGSHPHNSIANDAKQAHWNNFLSSPWGDYHGRFCRYDPQSSELLIEQHLLRSYTLTKDESTSSIFLRQMNTIYFDDERGAVVRGPWDITEACNTDRGIIHPRVGAGDDTTFLVAPSDGATAWVQHTIRDGAANVNQGVLRGLGKGYELPGFMTEMIVAHAPTARMSVGCVYDDAGLLRHITLNREDRAGWPSAFWSPAVAARRLRPADAAAALGLDPAAAARARGAGARVGSDVAQTPLRDVPWAGHSWALDGAGDGADGAGDEAAVVLGLPDGVVVTCPPRIPFGRPWAAGLLWRPGGPAGGGGAVQSLETRYSPAGIDCFRHVKFAL